MRLVEGIKNRFSKLFLLIFPLALLRYGRTRTVQNIWWNSWGACGRIPWECLHIFLLYYFTSRSWNLYKRSVAMLAFCSPLALASFCCASIVFVPIHFEPVMLFVYFQIYQTSPVMFEYLELKVLFQIMWI